MTITDVFEKEGANMVSKELVAIIFLGCFAVVSASAYSLCGDTGSPSFCNNIETGSMMTLSTGTVNTQLGNSFIMDSADFGIGIFNSVQVTSYSDDYPSEGYVSAFIRGSVKEGGRDLVDIYPAYAINGFYPSAMFDPTSGAITQGPSLFDFFEERAESLSMTMTFSDSTSFSGNIIDFRKSMSYSSSNYHYL